MHCRYHLKFEFELVSRCPSGLRGYVKAVFRKSVGSNPTLDSIFVLFSGSRTVCEVST